MKSNCLVIAGLLLLAVVCQAGDTGTSAWKTNDPKQALIRAVKRFQDARVGLSIHWGPSSLGGQEISWSRGKEIPVAPYDQYYRSFNPVKFDADAWCRFMNEAGFRYVVPTAKHHDGFSLWFSNVSDYDMENTPFHRDLIRDLIETICDNGNYLLNMGPRPDGAFDPREAAIVLEAGKWIRAHAEAIYETRGGPFSRADWGGSTHKDNRIFLFIKNPGANKLNLRITGMRFKLARLLGGTTIPFTQDDEYLHIDLSSMPRNSVATVVELYRYTY